MADIKQIQVSGTNYNIAGAAIVLEDNGTTTPGTWLAKTSQISSLVDGQLFLYKTTIGTDSNGQATLNINNLGAKRVGASEYDTSSDSITKRLDSPRGIYLLLVYTTNPGNDNVFQIVNATPSILTNITKICNSNNLYDGSRIEFYDGSLELKSGEARGDEYSIDVSFRDIHFQHQNNSPQHIEMTDEMDTFKLYIYNHDKDYMCLSSTKIVASNKLEIDCGGNRIEMDGQGSTKIYTYSSNLAHFYTWIIGNKNDINKEGIFTTRPIHLVDPNGPNYAFVEGMKKASMQYNTTDDSIDFVFD